MMFGLSRERVRQIDDKRIRRLIRIGHEFDTWPRTCGTKRRIWDDGLRRFRVYERPAWWARGKLERRVGREMKAAAKRQAQVDAARELFDRTGRVPTIAEIADQASCTKMGVYAAWGYVSDKTKRPRTISAKDATDGLFAAASLRKHPVGYYGLRALNAYGANHATLEPTPNLTQYQRNKLRALRGLRRGK